METVAVCLYSKYSQRCKEFLDDLRPGIDLNMLSIDNDDVRKAIINDNHGYNIRTVPCIFLFYSNGRLEKYEGSDAFTWLRKIKEVLETNTRPQQTLIQMPQQQQPIPEPEPLMPQQPSMVQEQPQQQQLLDITPVGEDGLQSISQQKNAEDIINQEMELRRASDQIITRKQDNIKELAQMMQRQRENDDDKIAPPPLYPKDRAFQ